MLSALKSVHCGFGKYSSACELSSIVYQVQPHNGVSFPSAATQSGWGDQGLHHYPNSTRAGIPVSDTVATALCKKAVFMVVSTKRQEILTRASDLENAAFRRPFCLRCRGCPGTAVSWLAELQLFPVRVDMTFMCLSHYPPCFVRDLLIWQNAEYYGHETYLSSWRTGSCYKDQFQPRLAGWSPLWVRSVCWRVHPFFHLPIIVPLVRPLALWTVVLLLCLGAVVRGFI